MSTPGSSWKDSVSKHRDADALTRTPRPLAVWRAFVPTETDPPDIRIRWFDGAVDDERLQKAVAKELQLSLRKAWGWGPSPPAHFLEVLIDESWQVSRITSGPVGDAPPDVLPMPRPHFLAKLVSGFTGERASRYHPAATYSAAVTSDGDIETTLEVLDSSLDRDRLLQSLEAGLGDSPLRHKEASWIHLELYTDGSTHYGCTTSAGAGPFVSEDDLIAAANLDLRARRTDSQ